MSKKSDPSQGMVRDPARPNGHKVPEPDNQAQFRQIQRGVNQADAAETKPRPAQKVTGEQDWRTG